MTTTETVTRYMLTVDPEGASRVLDTATDEVLVSTPYAHLADIVLDALEAVPA